MLRSSARYIVSPALVFILLAACFVLGAPPAAASWKGGHDAMGSKAPRETWYFAEGTTRDGFEEYLAMFNPGDRVALADVDYFLTDGRVVRLRYDLAPRSRATVDVGKQVPSGGDVSIKLSASEPVVAERAVYFEYRNAWSGGHVVAGAEGPASEWYFAEGCTRPGFDTYICLFNPGAAEAVLDIDYLCGDGSSTTRSGVTVGAGSRSTVAVHEVPAGLGRFDDYRGDVSVRVRSTNGVGVVAERPMYFQYRPYVTGGHDITGAEAPATTWHFAEGCTRPGFDTYVCLSNPGDRAASVEIEYHRGDGHLERRGGIRVGARSRYTVTAHEERDGVGRRDGPGGDFGITVRSVNGVPVVAERPMYFTYRPFWTDGHDALGALSPATAWYFAEGCTRPGYESYLCIQNPGFLEARVDILYYLGDGTAIERGDRAIAPHSRLTISMNDPANGCGAYDGSRGDVAVRVTSSNAMPVVAERSVYFAKRWRVLDKSALAAARGWGEVASGSPKGRVALTFDWEQNAANASRILDILRSRRAYATCFLLAGVAESYPGLLARIAAEGHEFANHGSTHRMSTRIGIGEMDWELGRTEAAVSRATGLSTRPYFRFPGGDRNQALIRKVNSLGYLSVYWSVDPQDWRPKSAAAVQAEVFSQVRDGSIILLHDRDVTVAALPGIIDGLRARGLEPLPLTDLF